MLKAIDTKEQYETALARVYDLMQQDIAENTSEYDELEALSILIKDYEAKYYPIP